MHGQIITHRLQFRKGTLGFFHTLKGTVNSIHQSRQEYSLPRARVRVYVRVCCAYTQGPVTVCVKQQQTHYE